MDNKKRYAILDEIRGFAIICMVFFHAFFTFGFLFNWSFAEELFFFFAPAEPFFAFAFIFISGICAKLTRSNLRRGLWLALVSLGLTAVTVFCEEVLYMSGTAIYFGVLHLLSVCMILYHFTGKLTDRLPALTFIVFVILTILSFNVKSGYFGIGDLSVELPTSFYETDWLAPLGFPTFTFSSSDYFPIIPWVFAFFAGSLFGKWVVAGNLPPWCERVHIPFFSFCGRKSLIIYLAHQPIIFGIGYLISLFI